MSALRPGLCEDNLLATNRLPYIGVFLANHLASTENTTRTTTRQNTHKRKLTLTQKVARINSCKTQSRNLRKERGRTESGLVAVYVIRPRNGAGLFFQPRSPHRANACTVI